MRFSIEPRRLSVRAKLLALIVAATVLPVGAVAYFSYANTLKALDGAQRARLLGGAATTAAAIESHLQKTVADLRHLVAVPPVQQLLAIRASPRCRIQKEPPGTTLMAQSHVSISSGTAVFPTRCSNGACASR